MPEDDDEDEPEESAEPAEDVDPDETASPAESEDSDTIVAFAIDRIGAAPAYGLATAAALGIQSLTLQLIRRDARHAAAKAGTRREAV